MLRFNGLRCSSDMKKWEIKNTPKSIDKIKMMYNTITIEQQEELQRTKTTETVTQTEPEDPYKTPEIKEGFLYNCHFKEWSIPMKEIQETITAMHIDYTDMGEKIGFCGLTADQTRQVKEISDINESIFWIDSVIPVVEKEPEQEQPITEQTEGYLNSISSECTCTCELVSRRDLHQSNTVNDRIELR
jgi:hypothetical protein